MSSLPTDTIEQDSAPLLRRAGQGGGPVHNHSTMKTATKIQALRPVSTKAMKRVVAARFCLTCLALLAAMPAIAHRPYEKEAGSFQRNDGQTISIVEFYRDGIIGPDPVVIQFRLADGTPVAHTATTFDAILHPVASGLEVYEFETTWWPVANRIELFDGHQLKDVTAARRSASVRVHFASHWVSYLVLLGLSGLFVGGWLALRALPKRGWWKAARFVGFSFIACAGALYTYCVLLFAPVSPLVLLGFGGILATAYGFFRKRTPNESVD